MDEAFIETYEGTNSTGFVHTRVGHWLHIRVLPTGEGYWTWLGKESVHGTTGETDQSTGSEIRS